MRWLDERLKIIHGIGYTLNMKLSVTLDRDEDGIWIAECPAIPGCVSQGKTKPAGVEKHQGSHRALPRSARERGLPLTVETQQVEFSSDALASGHQWAQNRPGI